jgi:hypothetical protein
LSIPSDAQVAVDLEELWGRYLMTTDQAEEEE